MARSSHHTQAQDGEKEQPKVDEGRAEGCATTELRCRVDPGVFQVLKHARRALSIQLERALSIGETLEWVSAAYLKSSPLDEESLERLRRETDKDLAAERARMNPIVDKARGLAEVMGLLPEDEAQEYADLSGVANELVAKAEATCSGGSSSASPAVRSGPARSGEGSGGACSVDSGGTCSGSCGGACSVDCGGACTVDCGGTCSGSCGGTCSVDSGGTCSGSCGGACSVDCGGACSGSCGGACSVDCGGMCSGEGPGVCSVDALGGPGRVQSLIEQVAAELMLEEAGAEVCPAGGSQLHSQELLQAALGGPLPLAARLASPVSRTLEPETGVPRPSDDCGVRADGGYSVSGSECSDQGEPFAFWRNGRLRFNHRRRYPTRAQRREILRRDGYQCSTPGCPHFAWLHIHHIEPFSRGGGTSERNLLCLCSRCHKNVHDGFLVIERGRAGELVFKDSRGRRLDETVKLALANWVDIWLGAPTERELYCGRFQTESWPLPIASGQGGALTPGVGVGGDWSGQMSPGPGLD